MDFNSETTIGACFFDTCAVFPAESGGLPPVGSFQIPIMARLIRTSATHNP
jgi:hypothetical protein